MIPPQNLPLFRYTFTSSSQGVQQVREPTDWEELGVTVHRDPQVHGVATEYTAQLGFVLNGRAYVARAYEAAGVEADVRLSIEQLDPNAFAWQPYYAGRLDLLGAEFTATSVKARVEPHSWLQKFLSRDSVKVDVFSGTSVSGSTGPEPIRREVELHSRAVLQRYAASQQNNVTTSAQMVGDENDPSREQVLYFGFDTPEFNELQLGAVAGGWVAGSAATAVPIYEATADGEHVIDLALYADITAQNDAGPLFQKVDAVCHFRVNGDPTTAVRLQPDVAERVNGSYQGTIRVAPRTFTAQLKQGDKLYLYADYYVHQVGGGATGIRYRATLKATMKPGSYLRITAKTTTASTLTWGLLLYEAFERLAQALTDEVDVFRSDFFGRTDRGYAVDGAGALTLLTGGFQVRGFPLLTDPAPAAGTLDLRKSLFTTWRELFDACAAVWGLGWGLEWVINAQGQLAQVLRVEPLAYWYRPEVVLDLTAVGPVTDSVKVSEARHYQTVDIGYGKWQAEQVGGLDEFNATRQWTTPLTTVKNGYTATSAISASGTLLETTRRDRYDATATTDTSQDATAFFVCLLRDGNTLVTERNQRALRLDGVLSPETVYNLRLSPGRILRRHAPVLAAGLRALPGAGLRFAAGEGNTGMVSQLLGEAGPVAEGGAVALADLPAPLWRPEQVDFRAPLRREQLLALLARPGGRVRYRSQTSGQVREGWLLDCKHVASQQQADFTLLPCAS